LIVLGIDPGSRYLGYGVIALKGSRQIHLAHGVVKADERATLAQRLGEIFNQLQVVVNLHKPDAMAVEGVFTHKNARSALILGHARGVALLLAAQASIPVFEYPPAKVKRSVGAHGAGSKDAVARMVCRLLEIEADGSRSDAYDALAVALCHAGSRRLAVLPSGPGRVGGSFSDRLKPGYRAPLPQPARSAP
jgi:crossover junction endodeoxyribonuclease RuvC